MSLWSDIRRAFGTGAVPAPPVALACPAKPQASPTSGVSRHEHFLACLAKYRHLAPRDASVKAFVIWMQELGQHGEHEQCWLQELYLSTCQMTGIERMPGKWFGKALLAHGCRRRQVEKIREGQRYRPLMVEIPPVGVAYATGANKRSERVRAYA